MKYYLKTTRSTHEISKARYYALSRRKNAKITIYVNNGKKVARVVELV